MPKAMPSALPEHPAACWGQIQEIPLLSIPSNVLETVQ